KSNGAVVLCRPSAQVCLLPRGPDVPQTDAWGQHREPKQPGSNRYPAVPGNGFFGAVTSVRAENLVLGSDQHGCSPGRSAVLITGHVPAVRVPPDHATSVGAAAVPARGDVEDRRDLDPAPSARRTAAAAAAPPEAELGGPGPVRGPARRDTQSAPPRIAAAGHPGLRSCAGTATSSGAPGPPGPCTPGPADRPPRHPAEHQGPDQPAGPPESRMGVPPDPR